MSKLTILITTDDHAKIFPPFMLANGALASDMEVNVFFSMRGLLLLKKGVADDIVSPNSGRKFIDLFRGVIEGGGHLIACTAAMEGMGLKQEDLIPETEYGGVITFLQLAEESEVVLTFC